MKPIEISLGRDQVEKWSKATAVQAIEEMLWNSFDADAECARVTTVLDENQLGVVQVRVEDDGQGILREQAVDKFGTLGGSSKQNIRCTAKGRAPRGRLGRGRFKAFALAQEVQWLSRYRDGAEVRQFRIEGNKSKPYPFEVSEPILSERAPGVEVVIGPINRAFPDLRNTEYLVEELAKRMALALHRHPFDIRVNGQKVTVDQFIKQRSQVSFDLPHEGENLQVTLDIIEWDGVQAKTVYLCDKNGVPLHDWDKHEVSSGKIFSYTVYARSILIEQLAADGAFLAEDMHPDVATLKSAINKSLESHFRTRRAELAGGLVATWKEEGVYPYADAENTPVTQVSREVFDVCAETVHDLLPKFQTSSTKNRKLIFKLIRQAVETDTGSLCDILEQVLSLDQKKREELAALLKYTSLGSVIGATKTVLDRLRFIEATEPLIFGEHAKDVSEPHQLQQILVNELWLFGDQYAFAQQEATLKSALKQHATRVGLDFDEKTGTIGNIKDRTKSRLDIMLNGTVRHGTRGAEHLVIELKRSSVTLTAKERTQIESYAATVSQDARFNTGTTIWNWYLIGKKCDNFIESLRNQKDRPHGLLVANKNGGGVWIKTWGEVIEEARQRYQFFLQALSVKLTAQDGLKYLHERHSEHLPKSLLNSGTFSVGESTAASDEATDPDPKPAHKAKKKKGAKDPGSEQK